MRIKDIFNIKNVSNFIEGNAKYYYEKLQPEPNYIREQRLYRLSQCKDDCLITGECIICGCPVNKKVFVNESCNPDRFPDIMNEEEWNKFKESEIFNTKE